MSRYDQDPTWLDSSPDDGNMFPASPGQSWGGESQPPPGQPPYPPQQPYLPQHPGYPGGYQSPGAPPPGGQYPGAPYPGQGYPAWRRSGGGPPPSGQRALARPAWVLIAMSGVLLLCVVCSIAGYAVIRSPSFATSSQQTTARAPVRAPKWTFKTTDYGGLPRDGPVIANGLIYLTLSTSGNYGTLLAVNAADGTLKWSAPGGFLPPVVADGVAYAFSPNSNLLYAYDASTGALKWTFHDDRGFLEGLPVVVNGATYVEWRNAVYALKSADGTRKWAFDGFYPYPPDGMGVAANGLLYVVGGDGILYVLNGTTGTPVWTRPSVSYVFAAEGTLYVNDQNHLYALNGTDGKQLWSFAVTKPGTQVVAEADGLVYAVAGQYTGQVRGTLAISASSGAIKWQNDQGDPLAVVDGTIYMQEYNASCALNAADGKQRWCKQANYDSFSVASGVFYGTEKTVVTHKRTVDIDHRKVAVIDYTFQRTLVALDATTSATRWTSPVLSKTTINTLGEGNPFTIASGVGKPVIAGGVVYQLMSDGKLYAIKA